MSVFMVVSILNFDHDFGHSKILSFWNQRPGRKNRRPGFWCFFFPSNYAGGEGWQSSKVPGNWIATSRTHLGTLKKLAIFGFRKILVGEICKFGQISKIRSPKKLTWDPKKGKEWIAQQNPWLSGANFGKSISFRIGKPPQISVWSYPTGLGARSQKYKPFEISEFVPDFPRIFFSESLSVQFCTYPEQVLVQQVPGNKFSFCFPSWCFQAFFIFTPNLGVSWFNLMSIFFKGGWFNHQLVPFAEPADSMALPLAHQRKTVSLKRAFELPFRLRFWGSGSEFNEMFGLKNSWRVLNF